MMDRICRFRSGLRAGHASSGGENDVVLDRRQATDEAVHFYIHPVFWPRSDIPESPDAHWPGFGFGIYTWTGPINPLPLLNDRTPPTATSTPRRQRNRLSVL